jgi:hypothetical protein
MIDMPGGRDDVVASVQPPSLYAPPGRIRAEMYQVPAVRSFFNKRIEGTLMRKRM